MQKFILAILACALLCIAPAYSQSEGCLQKKTELKQWQFRLDTDSVWRTVNLPHSCNSVDGQSSSYYRGTTHYRCTVDVQSVAPSHLLFKSAAQSAVVKVNGKQLMLHKGGYTPFSVDVTQALVPGQNLIEVDCNNEMDLTMAPVSSDFVKNNGLHDKVFLIEHSSLYADLHSMGYRGIHVVQQDINAKQANIVVQSRLVNAANSAAQCSMRAWLTDSNGKTVAEHFSQINIGACDTVAVNLPLSLRKPHLWQGTDDPYLYTAHFEVTAEGFVQEQCTARVGLRSMALDPDKGFLLNGKPYLLRGFSYHQDKFNRASAVTEADIDRDFEIIDELGCNMLRLAHYPHNEYTFDKCDERGIIVQTEIPWVNECGGDTTRYSQHEYEENLVAMFSEMIAGHYNHPCVAFWGMWNELGGSHANRPQGQLDAQFLVHVTNRLYALGRQLDATRFYGFADMGYGMDIAGLKRGVNYDYWGSNKYYGWYSDAQRPENASRMAEFIDKVRQRGEIASITEYGAGSSPFCHSEDPASTTGPSTGGARHDEEWANIVHEEHVRLISQRPWLIFTSCWVLFDFAVADRREGYLVSTDGIHTTTDPDKLYTNDKGIVSRDRQQKKDAFYLYKAWWNSAPTVYISSRRFAQRPSYQITIKVYSNAQQLTLLQNGKPVQTLKACPDVSGVIWTFNPVKFQNTTDHFQVEALMSDGSLYYDEVCFSHK